MTIDPVERLNLTMCAGALAASWVWASPAFAWSLAIGAVLETVNFRGLRRSSEAFFAGQLPGGWSAGFGVRFLGLTIGIGAAVWAGAHPVGLLVGLSMIVPAVVIEAWRAVGDPDERIDALLRSPHVRTLADFRDGIFRYREGVFTDSFFDFIREEDHARWVRDLNAEFLRWFEEFLTTLPHD